MENSKPLDQNHDSNPNLKADTHAAKLAYEAWTSNDPKKWDKAEAEKKAILERDPEAWRTAMKQIDVKEKKEHQAQALERQRQMQAAEAQLAFDQAQTARIAAQNAAMIAANNERTAAAAPPPVVQVPDEVVLARTHNGYAPTSELAPPPPDSPGYAAAYNKPPAKFYGLNLGIVKLGVNTHGSIEAGVNVGLAKAGVQVGLENRVDGEFLPYENTPLHARVGAGVGVDSDGFHAQAGGGANVFNLVNVDADGAARLGRDIGVDGDARAKVLFAKGQGAAGASLGENGVNAYGGGNADVAGAVGARGGGRVDLGPHTGAAAGVGLTSDGQTLDFGPSADAYPDGTVSGGVHLDPGKKDAPTYYPTGDREVDGTP